MSTDAPVATHSANDGGTAGTAPQASSLANTTAAAGLLPTNGGDSTLQPLDATQPNAQGAMEIDAAGDAAGGSDGVADGGAGAGDPTANQQQQQQYAQDMGKISDVLSTLGTKFGEIDTKFNTGLQALQSEVQALKDARAQEEKSAKDAANEATAARAKEQSDAVQKKANGMLQDLKAYLGSDGATPAVDAAPPADTKDATSMPIDAPKGVSDAQAEGLMSIIQKLKDELQSRDNGQVLASKANPQGQMLAPGGQATQHGTKYAGQKRKSEDGAPGGERSGGSLMPDKACEAGIALASKRQGNVGDCSVEQAFAYLRADVKAGLLAQDAYNEVTRKIKTDGYDLRGEVGFVYAGRHFEQDREVDCGALDSGHSYSVMDQNPQLFDRLTRLVSGHTAKTAHSALLHQRPVMFSHA